MGGIHSVSHPKAPASHLPATQSYISADKYLTKASNQRAAIDHSDRIAAIVKGHLCRRLLKTGKVQLIVKTIRDCQTLLVDSPLNSKSGNTQKPMSIQDLNFQERLLDQVSNTCTSCLFFINDVVVFAVFSDEVILFCSGKLVCKIYMTSSLNYQ